jgi:hypothetical protein
VVQKLLFHPSVLKIQMIQSVVSFWWVQAVRMEMVAVLGLLQLP